MLSYIVTYPLFQKFHLFQCCMFPSCYTRTIITHIPNAYMYSLNSKHTIVLFIGIHTNKTIVFYYTISLYLHCQPQLSRNQFHRLFLRPLILLITAINKFATNIENKIKPRVIENTLLQNIISGIDITANFLF